MKPMQEDGRALNGALIHLSRGRSDVTYASAICAQQASRLTYSGYEHLKELARFAWAQEDTTMRYCGPHCKSLVIHPREEPIRPYDESGLIEFGLYLIGDGAQSLPHDTVPNSKAMGGFCIMFGAGAIDWKSYRLHTCTPDSTSVKTLVASRLISRGVVPRGVAQFLGVSQERPTPLFTDNDGTWYISREAASTSSMTYIMRHVRFIQQASYDQMVKVYQIDGELNPPDALTKYKSKHDFQRHMAFIMGYPELALQLWRQCSKYKDYKYKKIVPVAELKTVKHEINKG